MKSVDLSLENLQAVLSAEKTLFFRALIRKINNQWKVYTLCVDNLPPFRKIKSDVLNYGDIAFIFGKASGHQISQWLENKIISIKGEEYLIPDFQPNTREDRFPSGMERFWIKLPYPFSTYELRHFDRDNIRESSEPLIKAGLPSFPDLVAATHYYLFGRESRPDQAIPDVLMFCIGHREGWIEKIELHSSAIKIRISGTKVKGSRLEVRAGMKHYETILSKSGKKTIEMPEGLPESVWIVLTYENDWLDYCKLNLRSNYIFTDDKIVSEVKDKPIELKGIIARGESETTEFKEEIPVRIEKLTKTVAAFANGKGGVIVIGVDDDASIVGIKTDITKENTRLAQLIRSSVLPQPVIRIDSILINGEWLLAVWVDPGQNAPYAINPKSPKYYVRRSASSVIATPEEVRSVSTAQSTNNITTNWWNSFKG